MNLVTQETDADALLVGAGLRRLAVKLCCETFGADHVLLATDSPHGPKGGEPALENYPRIVRECGISAKDADKILSGNARKLLGIG